MKAVFPQHKVGPLLETIRRVEHLTVDVALHKDGNTKRRNMSEYSNSVTWFTKDGALSVGLMNTQ